jgi:hypothetical protein
MARTFSEFRFTKPRFILCEGDDDKGFLEALVRERNLPEFQICHAAECNSDGTGGKVGFPGSLAGFAPISGFGQVKGLLVVTDNDDPPRSFSDIQRILTDNGYTPPPNPNGVGVCEGKPISVTMIPDPGTQGDLETFCLPEISRVWPQSPQCVQAYLDCTGATQWRKLSSIHKASARAAIVGCHEDDPYKGIGHLFRSGVLSTGNPRFDDLAGFLRDFDLICGIT